MKRLMSLGGNYFQMTAVKAAKRLGYYVIDVDYLPENPAHQYADEYHNISTLDMDRVLALAKKLEIDGIISYASDVSAPTAAYVAEHLGLPTNPLKSVDLLTHKDQFRSYMNEQGFSHLKTKEIHRKEDVVAFFEEFQKPFMLKPLHASGSKGVEKITCRADIDAAYEESMKYAKGAPLWAEEFVQRKGYQVDGDAFFVDGKIKFWGIGTQHRDSAECYVPTGNSFPCQISPGNSEKAKHLVERVSQSLGMKFGGFNIEFIVTEEDDIFILEIGPRNGGNLITDAIAISSGVDLAEYSAKAAVGDDVSDLEQRPMQRHVTSYLIHSLQDGNFADVKIAEDFPGKILRSDLFVQPGDFVHRYDNASYGIGAMLIEFDEEKDLLRCMDHMTDYIRVELQA